MTKIPDVMDGETFVKMAAAGKIGIRIDSLKERAKNMQKKVFEEFSKIPEITKKQGIYTVSITKDKIIILDPKFKEITKKDIVFDRDRYISEFNVNERIAIRKLIEQIAYNFWTEIYNPYIVSYDLSKMLQPFQPR